MAAVVDGSTRSARQMPPPFCHGRASLCSRSGLWELVSSALSVKRTACFTLRYSDHQQPPIDARRVSIAAMFVTC